MKRACCWTCLVVLITISSFGVATVSAFHFNPGVEVGDEIIWEFQAEYLSNDQTHYIKHDVTAIYDSDESTTEVCVNGSITQSDGSYLLSVTNGTRGVLEDYVQKDSVGDAIFGVHWYIVPEMKIGLFTTYYKWENTTFTSINNDYGMEISDIHLSIPYPQYTKVTVKYTKSGILEKFHGEDELGTRLRKIDLYSINGKKYREIPGFSVPIVLFGLFSGIIGLIAIIRKKNWHEVNK